MDRIAMADSAFGFSTLRITSSLSHAVARMSPMVLKYLFISPEGNHKPARRHHS